MSSRRNFLKKGMVGAVAAGATLSLGDKISARETGVTPSPWADDRGGILDRAAFEAQLNTSFLMGEDKSEAKVKLVKVTNLGSRSTGNRKREAFSLIFTGSNASKLNQNTYRIRHQRLGEFYFLIVPVMSGDQSHRYYEAVINRLHG